MKKFFYFLWSFFASSFIIFILFKSVFYVLKVYYPDKSLILGSFLISILILIFLKKNIFSLSNYLLKIYISILSGIFLSFIIFLLFPKLDFSFLIIKLSISFLIGFLITFLFSLKKTVRGLYFILVFLVFGIIVCFIISEMQKSFVRKYEKELQKIGFSFNLKEIFPLKYSKPQCDGWFDKLKILSDEKNEKWKKFYDEFIMAYQEDKFLKFLREGLNPKEEILKDPKIKDEIFKEFLNFNLSIKEEMNKCPYVQWFEPEEYKDKLWKVPFPNLLALMKFSRILQTYSIILKAEGKDEESNQTLMELFKAKEKIKIKGQPLLNILIGIAMERVYLIGEASSVSMGSKFLPDKIQRIEKISKDDLSALISSLNVECFSHFTYFKNPKSENFSDLFGYSVEKIIRYIPKFIFRAIIYPETKNYFYNVYQFYNYLKKVKPDENKYYWKDIENIKYRGGYFFPSLKSSYGRNLTLIAQARALLLTDEILMYFEQNNKLPENIDFFENPLFIDPFSEKKLIYKKIDEKKFMVYSTGWDEKDNEGKDLYISNAINFEKLNQDIGFCFSVK